MFPFVLDLSTLVTVSLTINFLAQWINNSWSLTAFAAQVRTWVLGILMALICMKLQVGIFAAPIFDVTWMPLWFVDSILGFCAALLANYGYDKLAFIKAFLEFIKVRVPIGDVPPRTN